MDSKNSTQEAEIVDASKQPFAEAEISSEKVTTGETIVEAEILTEVSEPLPNDSETWKDLEAGFDSSKERIEPLEKDQEDWKDRYWRLIAEFDNYKKRVNREKDTLIRFSNEQLLVAFMPVIDDLSRALQAAETSDNVQSIRDGIGLVYKNFIRSLEKQGVAPIEAVGEVFDSERHEAIAQVPAPTEEQKGRVLDEAEKGYLFHGKVIRYPKVVVGV